MAKPRRRRRIDGGTPAGAAPPGTARPELQRDPDQVPDESPDDTARSVEGEGSREQFARESVEGVSAREDLR